MLSVPVRNELLVAVANLVNAEEHLIYSLPRVPERASEGLRELISEVRALRSRLMRAIGFGGEGGELWCAAKHLLAAAYRVLEASEKSVSPDHDPERLAEESRHLLEYALVICDIQSELRREGGGGG